MVRGPNYPNAELLGGYDEATFELSHIVEDFRFARNMLRRLGPEERRRFSAAGWAWGDTTNYGGAPEEIVEAQLPCVLETLGLDLSGCFHYEYTEGEVPEDSILADLLAPGGKPVSRADVDPGGYWEDVLVAELRGKAGEIRRLRRGLAGVKPDLTFYRARPNSETHERLRARHEGDAALFFLLPGELGMMQDSVHDGLFEWLIRDWEVRNGKRKPQARPQDRGRARALRRRRLARRLVPGRLRGALRLAAHKAGKDARGARNGRQGREHPEDPGLRRPALGPRPLRGRHRARKGPRKGARDPRPALRAPCSSP